MMVLESFISSSICTVKALACDWAFTLCISAIIFCFSRFGTRPNRTARKKYKSTLHWLQLEITSTLPACAQIYHTYILHILELWIKFSEKTKTIKCLFILDKRENFICFYFLMQCLSQCLVNFNLELYSLSGTVDIHGAAFIFEIVKKSARTLSLWPKQWQMSERESISKFLHLHYIPKWVFHMTSRQGQPHSGTGLMTSLV